MDTNLAEKGLTLSYLHDPSESRALESCGFLEDVCEDRIAGTMLPKHSGVRMASSNHLIVALGANGGTCRGALAANDMATEREPFLCLDSAYVSPLVRASYVLERMLALAILRIAGDATLPTVIAGCVPTGREPNVMHQIGQRFTGARLFPAPAKTAVIDLGMAALARRIARVMRPTWRYDVGTGAFLYAGETLVVIDLGAIDEAIILDTARKLYRSRPKGSRRRTSARNPSGVTSAPQQLYDATAS
jgi:hypothetical protein